MNDIHKMMQQQADILKKISSPKTIGNLMGPAPGIFIEMKKARERSIAKGLHLYPVPTFAMIKPPKVGFSNVSSFAMIKPPKVEFPSISITSGYMTKMNMAIRETTLFDYLKLPKIGIANMALDRTALIHYTDMSQNLLKPLSYLEEHARKMSMKVLGINALHITAFFAIDAVETQFRFFQQDTTLEKPFSQTPLYSYLNQFSDLNLEYLETEEDWHDAFLDKIQAFLGTTIDNSQEYAFSFIHYIAKKNWELFSIALTVCIYTQSPSLQYVQEIGQKVDEVRRTQITQIEEQDQRLTKMEEQDQRLTKKIDSILELLEKSNNPHKEESLSSEAQALYYTINDVEVKSEPSTTASSIAALAIDESINVIEKQNDEWVQIEFFDYIHWEIRKGWLQTHDVKPLVLRREQDANPIDEAATPSTQQLAEASNRIHNRYAKTFQRLAKE